MPRMFPNGSTTPAGVVFEADTDDLDYLARYVMALNLPFVIQNPPELRQALLRLADQMKAIAAA